MVQDDAEYLLACNERLKRWQYILAQLERGHRSGFSRETCEERIAHWIAEMMETRG
jgi:hypothetical protein